MSLGPVLETPRLGLWELVPDDAAFMLALLNSPGFLANIGDRGVRTVEEARDYLAVTPMTAYERAGYGFYRVDLKASGEPIGICGLVKRDVLDAPDLGFAFLERFWGQGYASEAAAAVLAFGRERRGLDRILGVTSLDNAGSIAVLEKVGLRFERIVEFPPGRPARLFGGGRGDAAPEG